ncbi:MAG: glutamate/gamma-aminobutyrate family transporter YjeM [Lactobacillus sp.]|nr:glutamate/gamma-aminobutyrate family transporter YjeM [Lactobacillus sp.]
MNKKIGVTALILMIFSSIFGFANSAVAYLQMGYASIIWYILAAILFFLPVSLMIAEYGSTFKDASGGLYSWMKETVGEKVAFCGTFIWISAWIIWLVATSNKIYITLSSFLFGKDLTQSISIFGLNATASLGLLAILWMLILTALAKRGTGIISKVSSIGGTFTTAMIGVFLVASIVIIIMNHGHLAEPISFNSFIKSPNPQFNTTSATLGFVVYAIFAYAGMESFGGLTDSLDKPEKTFPRGLLFASLFIAIAYSLMIFLWGCTTNWRTVLGRNNITIGNVTFYMMKSLGFTFGQSLHLGNSTSMMLGDWFMRFTAFGNFIGYIGSMFVLVYTPIKSFILGSKDLWSEKVVKLNKHGIPATALNYQAILVCVILFLVSFGGSNAQVFYTILTDMSNIATCVPYLFLVAAFPFFKKKGYKQSFEVFKNQKITVFVTVITMLVLISGILFTCIDPIVQHQYQTAFWTIIRPIFFGVLALIIYSRAKKQK